MATLNWKPANKRQQEQYWCGSNALVARVNKTVLADRNSQVELALEIIVTGETVTFHYENDDYTFSFEKQVNGLAAGQSAAEDIFKTRLCGDTLIQAGYKETY